MLPRDTPTVSIVACAGSTGILRRHNLFQISEGAPDRLFAFADDHDLHAPVQFHSHETGAFLSRTDAKHGLRVEGFTSVVVPTYSAPLCEMGRWGWWCFTAGVWAATFPPIGHGPVTAVRFDEDGVHAEHSRALLLATQVSGASASQLERRLDDSVVAISVDAEMPQSELVARVLITTLRRGPGHLVLIRDGLPTRIVDALLAACAAVDPTRPLRVARTAPDDLTARVHVGPSLPGQAIRVVPDGCGAHLAGARTAVIRPVRAGNALGAIYAAALGAGEVFKHTARVVTRRRVVHRQSTSTKRGRRPCRTTAVVPPGVRLFTLYEISSFPLRASSGCTRAS